MLATGSASAAAAAKKSESKRATATSVAKKPAGKRSTSVNRAVRVKASSRAKQRVRSAARGGANVRRASVVVPARLSYGQVYGLHETADPLDLKSSVALVLDQETNEVLLSKNSQAVLPIASLTKLMTALVVIEAQQPLDEVLTITAEDIDTEKGSSSRLALGTELTRGEMLHLALMSSENRAANALGRHFPGGLAAFVTAMNHKAAELGMQDTRYVEPTGLSSRNQSSARDLATLVKTAHHYPLIRELSTSPEYEVAVGKRHLQYRNTNGLVFNPTWEIGLQKTGYISEAGRCLVMQAQLAGRKLIMVFLDSTGRYSRIGDAERVRKWLEELSLSEEPEMPDTEVLPRVTS
ncbi:D-alanyl-D-alanine endopeptidase [Schlegelella sp. S2-27]|uniref:D-alanyl-D-alanine endopeptidase n=1 Tax=Caldimonas mangrovi TaxID=2944811 RepID=A0ABT0YMY2_9BURK|nr:D-alanyl-D-alanine endopeptidase [Caldimonas mangrovi]MCM5679784.1 D-alanyl-D-alanine endopeptidase [Caldimonas mangrovi]